MAATETALAQLMSKPLDDLNLVAFMVDGVPFGESTGVVALGIDIDGTRHPLSVERGRPRTPPWSPGWSPACATAAWTAACAGLALALLAVAVFLGPGSDRWVL